MLWQTLGTPSFRHLIVLPLYIDDSDIDKCFSPQVAEALRRISVATRNRPIVPDTAVTQILSHLGPLLADEHLDVLLKLRPASWSAILRSFVELTARGLRKDEHLLEVGAAIKVIYEHSSSSARKPSFPRHIEVSYFFRICHTLNSTGVVVDVPEDRATSPMFCFCKYCWRQSVPRRGLCPTHAPAKFSDGETTTQDKATSNSKNAMYKSGQRHQVFFDTAINQLIGVELLEFHESNFKADVLFHKHLIADWAEVRRPNLWQKIAERGTMPTNDNALERLLDFLFDVEEPSRLVARAFDDAKAELRAMPLLAWPILTRAEAFFRSEKLLVGKRGGARPGSGRKR